MSGPPSLADLYLQLASALRRTLSARFPRLCVGRVEDAVSDTFVIAAASPELIGNAFAKGGVAHVQSLLHLIAWRCARATVCRGAGARETPCDELPEPTAWRAPPQEILADLHLHLASVVQDCSREVCAKHADALAQALLDRLASGQEDAVVAKRHGVPREYLNQARRGAARRMLGVG